MDAMGAIVGCGGRVREVERKIASLLCASGFIYKMSHDPPPRPSTQHLLNPQPNISSTLNPQRWRRDGGDCFSAFCFVFFLVFFPVFFRCFRPSGVRS
jgi:hypothetical protein